MTASEYWGIKYNDVRDRLVELPEFGHDGYATLDLFPVRFDYIAKLEPAPLSLFEFGAYRGYFLVTAMLAQPLIRHVGWVDNEGHTPESNRLCMTNVQSIRPHAKFDYWERPDYSYQFGQADLVQVDGHHSYESCLTDLIWADALAPATIMVDDFTAHQPVREATKDFASWRGWEIEELVTVNGLAVLRRGL